MDPRLLSSLWIMVAVTSETWLLFVSSLVLAAVATKIKP